MKERKIHVGDKVAINLERVYENGEYKGDEQYEWLSYIKEHPDEVYTVAGINCVYDAPFILGHEILINTSFFEDELILQEVKE